MRDGIQGVIRWLNRERKRHEREASLSDYQRGYLAALEDALAEARANVPVQPIHQC